MIFNPFGLVFMILIMIPNIIYAVKCKDDFVKLPQSKFWKILEIFEQIGRYGCFACMVSGHDVAGAQKASCACKAEHTCVPCFPCGYMLP